MDSVIADACETVLLPGAVDEMPHLAEAGQLSAIDVDQVSYRLALVALNTIHELQISQPAQAQAVQGHGGEGCREQLAM